MLDDVKDLQHFLPDEYKNDPRMAAAVKRMLEAGKAIVMSFFSMNIPIPDDEELNLEIAKAAGLNSVRQFEMIRLAMQGRGVLQKASTIEGDKWSLTPQGRAYAARLMEKAVKSGKIDQAIADEYAADARAAFQDEAEDILLTSKASDIFTVGGVGYYGHDCDPDCVRYLDEGGTEAHAPQFKVCEEPT